MANKSSAPSPLIQLVVNFVIPIFILGRFSAESQLGPVKSMLLALAFPVALEAYSIFKRKKVGIWSIFAILGILITGGISLLGLSEGWLALRRSLFFFVVAVVLFVSIWVKRSILTLLLPYMLDMDRVIAVAHKKQMSGEVDRCIMRTGYMLGLVFVGVGLSSYILTLVVITGHAGTTNFNEEYIRLKLLALPFTTLPLFAGIAGSLMYLVLKIGKLTGLSVEDVFKKKD